MVHKLAENTLNFTNKETEIKTKALLLFASIELANIRKSLTICGATGGLILLVKA